MVEVESYESLVEELALLRDVHRGLADVEAGRVIPHDEVRRRLRATAGPGGGGPQALGQLGFSGEP